MAKQKISLEKISTRAPKNWDKDEYKKKLKSLLVELDELQNLLYASATHSILVVIQGMDASGKDGLINDVLGQLNPQGVKVKSYKAPTALEQAHDFLWRIHSETPAKGEIKVFNRSHYEDILITRVHHWIDDDTAAQRIKAINHFEQLLTANNTIILKLYLHISPEEQIERLEERLLIPRKMWKYNAQDLEEAKRWDDYRKYFEIAINECNEVPWHIIPSDQNWVKSYTVAKLLVETIQTLDLKYPGLKPEDQLLAAALKKEIKRAVKK